MKLCQLNTWPFILSECISIPKSSFSSFPKEQKKLSHSFCGY